MSKRNWKLDYQASNRVETTFHATREAAMKALYDRLDLEQRDALNPAFLDQRAADALGKIRANMVSQWRDVVRCKVRGNVVYSNLMGRITRA